MRELRPKQAEFARLVVLNGGDKLKARADAGYSTNMSKKSQGVDADKIYNHTRVSLEIKRLQKEADKAAEKSFTVDIEQRIKWLDEVAKAGLGTYTDGNGKERRENLPATCKAIDTLNSMLGINEQGEKTKPVKVFVGVEDAS